MFGRKLEKGLKTFRVQSVELSEWFSEEQNAGRNADAERRLLMRVQKRIGLRGIVLHSSKKAGYILSTP